MDHQLTSEGSETIISQNYHLQHQHNHGQHHYQQQHHVMQYQEESMYPLDVVSSMTSLKDASSTGYPDITNIERDDKTLSDMINESGVSLDSETTGFLLGLISGHHHQEDQVIISTDSVGGVTVNNGTPSSFHDNQPDCPGYHDHQVNLNGMTRVPDLATSSTSSSSFKTNNPEGSSISSSSSTTISGDHHGMFYIACCTDSDEETEIAKQMKINVDSLVCFCCECNFRRQNLLLPS
jgi:hypothetical protein